MSITTKTAERLGLVRDYHGENPCIPPTVLAKLCWRLGLGYVRAVRQDEVVIEAHEEAAP